MLLLVFADRNVRRLVDADIRRHQHRIGVEADRRALLVLAALLLELGHAVEPAKARDAIEDPRQLGMLLHHRLCEDRRMLRIDARGDIRRRHFARGFAHIRGKGVAGILRQGMHVHHAEKAGHLVLHAHPILQRAQIIAEVQRVGGLHAGKDELRVGAHGVPLEGGRYARKGSRPSRASSSSTFSSRASTLFSRSGWVILWPNPSRT